MSGAPAWPQLGLALAAVAAVAAADREYAAADLDGWDASGALLQPATAILQRELGAWHVLVLGGDSLGCVIPAEEAAVRRQLGAGCAAG